MNISDSRKSRLVNTYINAAKTYSNFIGYIFEVHTVEKIYKLEFNIKDFKHLCGVKSNLSNRDFYQNSLNGTLAINNINSIQPKDWNSLKGKEKCLLNFKYLIETPTDTLFLEELDTGTCTFPVALRNDVKDIAIAFKSNSNYYARSLRKARHSLNCLKSSRIIKVYKISKNDKNDIKIVYESC